MNRTVVQHLLALLVVWGFANDAWAAITPEPSDDVAAADDNVYLSVSVDSGSSCLSDRDTPLVTAGPVESQQPSQPASPHPPVPVRPGARLLVYLLMTLRR